MSRKFTVPFMLAGALCLIAALVLSFRNVAEEKHAEASVAESVTYLAETITVKPPALQPVIPEPQVLMTEVEYEGRNYIGVLAVSSLDLSLSVQGDWNYTLLRESPCLYVGNIYEGMILAGHNYSAHFGRLKNLSPGDAVTFTDVDGNVWHYTVSALDLIEGTDIESMVSGGWDLTLFTCTPGGQSRVTVRCTLNQEI